jgi:uncharacterized protein YaiL (DUF2058 family)
MSAAAARSDVMGDLRDAFKKAGLIDDKTDRRLKHEERVEKKELGREGLDERRRKEDEARRARDDQKRADVKSAQQRLDHEREREERWKRLLARVESESLKSGGGPRRFHYREPDGHLPFQQVDDETGRRLEAGEFAIARRPDSEETVILPRALALELAAVRPEAVVFLAGR